MEEKKSAKANLENERTTFFLLGFIVVLSSLFVAFEWKSEEYLSPDWVGFSPLFIENEASDVSEVLPAEENNPAPQEEVAEIKPEVVFDDFNIVEQALPEEIARELEEKTPPETASTEKPAQDTLHSAADAPPSFEGGETGLIRFIYKTMQYPSEALNYRIQGKVWCSLIVEKDGSLSDIKIEKSLYPLLDAEALRTLNLMPAWKPAHKAGKAVRMKVYLPVVFKL